MNIWMNEIWIRLDILLLFNFLTGAAAYLIWRLTVRLWKDRRSVRYLHRGLQGVILCFCVPAAYTLMYLHFRDFDGSWNGNFMNGTGFLMRAAFGIAAVWLLGVLVSVARCGRELYRECPVKGVVVPENQSEVRVLRQLGKIMGIRRRIPVCRGERLTPAIGGFFRTRLYLGTEPLEEEELRIIFRHELYHYRHGDIWIRRLLLLLRIFCWFCPWFTCGKISEEYRRLSEDYVDEEVCREEDMGRYIRTLLKTALQGAEKMHLTQVTAAENRCDVLRRIENMKNRQSKKQIRRTMAVIWIAACLFLGTAVVYAADTGVIKGYEALYRATVAENEDQGEQKIYIEYYEEPDDSWVAEEGEVMEIVNTSSLLIQDHLVAIDWTVEANAVRTTPSFEIYFPRDITMVVSAESAGQEVRAGIVEPDGTRRYIIGSGTTVWSFSVDQDGRYKIFTENPNHTEAYVEISCWL